MPIERPSRSGPDRLVRQAHQLIRTGGRRILLAVLTGLGIALGTYGGIEAISQEGTSETKLEAPGEAPVSQPERLDRWELGTDERAVPLANDQHLPLDVGDRVELVAVVPGPLDDVAEMVTTARVLHVDDEIVLVAVDQRSAIELVRVQANGVVRLLGLP